MTLVVLVSWKRDGLQHQTEICRCPQRFPQVGLKCGNTLRRFQAVIMRECVSADLLPGTRPNLLQQGTAEMEWVLVLIQAHLTHLRIRRKTRVVVVWPLDRQST